jgi:hypothetical protein
MEVHPVDMRVDDVKIRSLPGDGFEQGRLGCHRIGTRSAQAKGPRPDGVESCRCYGIAAGEQRHFMSKMHQLLDQPGNDTLRAAVKLGGNAFSQGRYLGNPH